MQFGIGHPPPTHQLQSTSVGEGSRVPNLQTEFNYLDSFKSYGIFSDFVVAIIPTSSLCHFHHPHIIPIVSRRSPCGPHGCGLHGLLCCLCGLHPMLSPWSLWSPWSPCHPHHPHVIAISSLSSPHHPHSPQKVPMWSPWLWSPWSPLLSLWSPPMLSPWSPWSPYHPRHPHVIPVSSPHCLEGSHIIPNPPKYPLHPPITPLGWGGSQISKNAIRFEIIEIF